MIEKMFLCLLSGVAVFYAIKFYNEKSYSDELEQALSDMIKIQNESCEVETNGTGYYHL